jgi:P27 family predicted phage terminase small subunit
MSAPSSAVDSQVGVAPPAWLSDDGKTYWADLLRHLDNGVVKPADVHAFAMLCNELATYAEADAIVQEAGILIDTGAGLATNPALTIRSNAAAAVQKWSAYLRITPDDTSHRHREQSAAGARLRHRREQ